MKVALYARVSSDQQAEKNNSIPSQLRLLHEYADKHNMTVYKEYIDEGESALSVNRPAFLEMISETKKKFPPFQAILVWKLSRFARNRQDSILYKSLLKKRGLDVISISEPIDDTPQGQLMEGMIEVIDAGPGLRHLVGLKFKVGQFPRELWGAHKKIRQRIQTGRKFQVISN